MEALEEAKDIKKLSLKPTDVIVFRVSPKMHTQDMRIALKKTLDECKIKNKCMLITNDVEIFVLSQEEAVLESL